MAFFSFRKPHRDTEPEPALVAAETKTDVLVRFLTVGGAAVELRACRFTTRWHPWKGCPDVVAEPYETDGFTWECLGCGVNDRGGGGGYGERGYLPKQRHKARDDANAHANNCRAMPRPEVP